MGRYLNRSHMTLDCRSLLDVCAQTKPEWLRRLRISTAPSVEKQMEAVLVKIQNSPGDAEDVHKYWEDLKLLTSTNKSLAVSAF